VPREAGHDDATNNVARLGKRSPEIRATIGDHIRISLVDDGAAW